MNPRKSLAPKKPFGIVSVFNDDPEYLFDLFDGIAIYDNSEIQRTWAFPKEPYSYRQIGNVGHSLANFLDWIVEN